MKVGFMVDAQDGLTWERWQRLAVQAEEMGYESLWRSDHLVSVVGRFERPALEAWASLTYLATATKRLRFGALVTPVTFRHPSLLALMAAAVDVLSGGRLEVGMGIGWEPREHEAFGIPFPDVRTRLECLGEAVAVMRLLWTGEEAFYTGRHYTLDGARGHPIPVQRPGPPIIVAGLGEEVLLRIAAEQSTEWNAHGLAVEEYRRKVSVFERHCVAANRDPSTVRRSVAGAVVVAKSRREVERRIANLANLIPLPVFFPPGAGATPAELRARGWFAGSPDDIIRQVEALESAGVHRVMFQQLDLADDETIELIAELILPHIAQRSAD
jgi:F420-dependent oxidoreductase-like protein